MTSFTTSTARAPSMRASALTKLYERMHLGPKVHGVKEKNNDLVRGAVREFPTFHEFVKCEEFGALSKVAGIDCPLILPDDGIE